ncbi:uncharacterized protein LOC120630642 [Pararge aegeria]|uniref:uncharacterized protein LOC120630642 n=1 Tax=Pararge aegeria TaxID=116150 RepID=UPI0019CF79D3|nr:uncharacterized protein LOC120630642 [Pararge aegeria]
MPPNPILVKTETAKNALVAPSRIVSRPDKLEGGEETEIAAQIVVPQESCWGLIVGFYFDKLRSIALAIASCGSSVGVMAFYPLNSYLVGLAGWRTTILLHSGLIGLIYFIGMTFRPVLSFNVVKTTEDQTRTVTYLPNLSTAGLRLATSRTKTDNKTLEPTATERLFNAISNSNFPTAAALIEDTVVTSADQPGPSAAAVSKLTLTANVPQGGISPRQLKQVKSILSKTSVQDKSKPLPVEISVTVKKPKKKSCWGRLCHWEQHVPASRPMYRDDVFYEGKLEKLEAYQKSTMATATSKTGLEYQLAVSRAATAGDLREKRGVFTTAARRVLASMMDPKLFRKKSFICLCFAGCSINLGFLTPYIFIQNRNSEAGVDPEHCAFFVSVIAFANALGRLILGGIACKVDPIYVYIVSMLIAGTSTSMLKHLYGFSVAFYMAGIFIAAGGIILLPVKRMSEKENKIAELQNIQAHISKRKK